jgi:hypothetical protein
MFVETGIGDALYRYLQNGEKVISIVGMIEEVKSDQKGFISLNHSLVKSWKFIVSIKLDCILLFTLQHTFQGNREHQDRRDPQECRAVLEPKERYINGYELVVK